MKDQRLIISFLASGLIHLLAIPIISALIVSSSLLSRQNFIPIDLVDVPRPPGKKEPLTLPKPPPPPPKAEVKVPKPAPLPPPARREIPKQENLATKKSEPEEPLTLSPSASGGGEAQSAAVGTPGTGSEAGNLFDGGDVAVRGGEGLGKSGTGRGIGPPGPGTGEKGFREAKPVQTAKASYPPMALRMGLEADVTLKVSVDKEGKVTRVEIAKSAGMGFDEEALKAVKQFRFEPARRDGENVASEFTYIYRFRLEK